MSWKFLKYFCFSYIVQFKSTQTQFQIKSCIGLICFYIYYYCSSWFRDFGQSIQNENPGNSGVKSVLYWSYCKLKQQLINKCNKFCDTKKLVIIFQLYMGLDTVYLSRPTVIQIFTLPEKRIRSKMNIIFDH